MIYRYTLVLMCCALLALSACKSDKAQEDSTSTIDEQAELEKLKQELEANPEEMSEEEAFCKIIRIVDLGAGPSIFLLDICPDDDKDLGIGLNIAEEGEPSVTVLFDTLRSFPDVQAARDYALVNNVYDVALDHQAY